MKISDIGRDNRCRGCGVCAAVCPAGAIAMELNSQGFFYASVEDDRCIQCGKCEQVCTVISEGMSSQKVQAVYYAYQLNEERRMQSSSGGIAGALAEAAIKDGYKIIGASYDYDENRVKHAVVEDAKSYYSQIAGSKYVPSNTLEAFSKIGEMDKVLVIGTPCQIQALKRAYPHKKNLLCIDFRCYGVCGYGLWDKYIQSIRKKFQKRITHINFRSKKASWLKWGVEICFENGARYFKPKTKDSFGRIFSGFENAGRHCLECRASEQNSFADLRLEDGWQLSKFLTKDDYKKGASQVTIMSEKGMELWEKTLTKLYYRDVGIEHGLHGCRKHPYKEDLNRLIDDPDMGIEDVIREYGGGIPVLTRFFYWGCDLLLDFPGFYFFLKRVYRKLWKID